MTRLILLITFFVGAMVFADDRVDPRLAGVRKAFVMAGDDLSDDRVIANCLTERLARSTPVQVVSSRDEAEVILTVIKGSVGKHPKAEITAALPDGTLLWAGKSKTRGFNLVGRNMTCVLAEDLIGNLRKAMQQSHGK